MKIFLVRHGETKYLKEKIIQTPESYLNKRGIAQAKEVAKRSRFRTIDRVISSPWPRAKETAEIIAKELKKPHEVFEGIHEMKLPSIYGEKSDGKVLEKFIKERSKNLENLDWKYSKKEESPKEVIKRVNLFQDHLIKKHINERILVVTHGIIIRTFITSAILGKEYDDKVFSRIYYSLYVATTGISFLGYNKESKRWRVYYINDHSHLANVKER